jgi:hypothetical protein
MDRLELEALAEKMADRVQFDGYAVAHDVSDPSFLRDLLRSQARERSMRIRTGVSGAAATTVWASRPDGDLGFARPRAASDQDSAVETIDRLLQTGDDG